MKKRHYSCSKGLMLIAFACLGLGACGPNEQQKAEWAEQKRIECLDKFCQRDVEPPRDYAKDALLKVNGQFFVGPKEYFSARSPSGFYWPSKTPMYRGGAYPEKGQYMNAIGIEVFFTGRQKWHDPKAITPWLVKVEERFEELQKEGFRMERQHLRPDLERVRFFDAQGKSYLREFFIATNEKKPLGAQAPSINCEPPDVSGTVDALAGCSGGFFWQPDIYVDFRLHAKHASDWPEIYKEIIRLLALLKKV